MRVLAHVHTLNDEAVIEQVLGWAEERGWRRLRLLSSLENDYKRDYLGETAEGDQRPMLNVFHREGEKIRHSWGAELTYRPPDPGQDHLWRFGNAVRVSRDLRRMADGDSLSLDRGADEPAQPVLHEVVGAEPLWLRDRPSDG
jgi:hypothetical protein